MHIDFKFHNLESSDAIKSHATDKLGKLLTDPSQPHVQRHNLLRRAQTIKLGAWRR